MSQLKISLEIEELGKIVSILKAISLDLIIICDEIAALRQQLRLRSYKT